MIIPYYLSQPYFKLDSKPPVYHSTSSDGIIFPSSNSNITGIPCPPNTYNDICAHTLLNNIIKNYTVPLAYGDNVPQPQCKSCPPGFHTAGLSGFWSFYINMVYIDITLTLMVHRRLVLPSSARTNHVDR